MNVSPASPDYYITVRVAAAILLIVILLPEQWWKIVVFKFGFPFIYILYIYILAIGSTNQLFPIVLSFRSASPTKSE